MLRRYIEEEENLMKEKESNFQHSFYENEF